MKRKLKSDRGFTLAELLIVVAIIGVLVAIAIPIFTSQLERSREAVDLSDVRSAYAEVMMAAITGDTSATYTKDSGQKIYKETDGTYSIMVTPLKQQKDGWQTPLPITIGGVSSNAGDTYWKCIPGPKGYCVITYHPPTSTKDEYVSFYWNGGTNSGNSGSGGDNTNPATPTLTPTPGTNNGNNTSGGGSLDSYHVVDWPSVPNDDKTHTLQLEIGQIIRYGKMYFISAAKKPYTYSQGWSTTPDSDAFKEVLVQVSNKVYTSNQAMNGKLSNVQFGDIYQCVNGDMYIFHSRYFHDPLVPPTSGTDWIKILK